MKAHAKEIAACPLAAVDQRLADGHRFWHQAETVYFDPDGFRLAAQSAIQTLRSVTFILQKNKHAIAGFGQWYEGWQKRLRADELMRWIVDARNRIEKGGRSRNAQLSSMRGPTSRYDATAADHPHGCSGRTHHLVLGMPLAGVSASA
jgi:hypothetical protein